MISSSFDVSLFRLESEFAGITNTPSFASTIQKSFMNQTSTLVRTADEEMELLTFHCFSCNLEMEEERGDYICPHCGRVMEEEETEEVEVEEG